MQPVITLTTDFGTQDSYVGVMKGVILSICPDVHLVDITHDIPPQNMTAAAFVVRSYTPYFPPGTIHLVVVDPGVGSTRQPVALSTPDACYVGPNNGVFGLVWQDALQRWSLSEVRAVVLAEPQFWLPNVSMTFHGRDIFAPVAAHLAAGVRFEQLGHRLSRPLPLDVPEPVWAEHVRLFGSVLYIDHFGNCVSNITAEHLEKLGQPHELYVTAVGHKFPVKQTYADVGPGEAVALVGSDGYLELSVRDGNASQLLGIRFGTELQVDRTAPLHLQPTSV